MKSLSLWLAAGAFLLPAVASAQNQFVLRVQQGSNVTQVANGTTLTFSAPAPGASRSAQILITYIGSTSVRFPSGVQIVGSPAFIAQPVSGGTPGSTLLPNQTATIDVIFTASTTSPAQAQLDLDFIESSTPAVNGLLTLGLTGGVPVYSLTYAVGAGGNATLLPPDGQMVFPDTVVNSNAAATTTLTNKGSGVGQVTSVSVSGGAFTLASLPALPLVLGVSGNLPFQVVYQPRKAGTDTGTLTIAFDGGITQTYQLIGHGILSQLSYEVIPPGGTASPIVPGQTILFPQTSLGQTAQLQIRYTNSSATDVTIAGIAVTGPPFAVSNLPLIPTTVAPSASGTFTVSFAPTQSGALTGGLRVGNDNFALAASAPSLTYSYRSSSGTTTPVDPLGTVTAPSVAVGNSSSVVFTVVNQGTAVAVVNSIGLTADGGGAFRLNDLPALPYQLPPQGSLSFTLQFLPNNTGFATGALRIESASFTLSGFGQTAVPLPDYTISGPTQVAPLDQPSIGLTLSQPYSLPLTGTLKLLVASNYGTDPAIQFSSGGTSVNFTIPANTTQAVFPNGATAIRYQAGSVAGSITVRPTFTTQGGLDLTPSSPTVLQATMAAAAPKLLGVQVSGRDLTTITLTVSGITTIRSLTKMNFSFTAAPGFDMPNLTFPVDLTGASATWFASSASQAFGGQFALGVQFLLSTSDKSTSATAPTRALQSVTVVVSSSNGDSNPVTLNLQ
jgi:hypothetical protein